MTKFELVGGCNQSPSTINCNTIVEIILQYILPFFCIYNYALVQLIAINCNTIAISGVRIYLHVMPSLKARLMHAREKCKTFSIKLALLINSEHTHYQNTI